LTITDTANLEVASELCGQPGATPDPQRQLHRHPGIAPRVCQIRSAWWDKTRASLPSWMPGVAWAR